MALTDFTLFIHWKWNLFLSSPWKILVDMRAFKSIRKTLYFSFFSMLIFVLFVRFWVRALHDHKGNFVLSNDFAHRKLTNTDFIRYAWHLAKSIKLSLCAAGELFFTSFLRVTYFTSDCHLLHQFLFVSDLLSKCWNDKIYKLCSHKNEIKRRYTLREW